MSHIASEIMRWQLQGVDPIFLWTCPLILNVHLELTHQIQSGEMRHAVALALVMLYVNFDFR